MLPPHLLLSHSIPSHGPPPIDMSHLTRIFPPSSSELIVSCGKPSQELLSLSLAKYSYCAADGGAEEGTGNSSQRDAREVFEEVENKEGR